MHNIQYFVETYVIPVQLMLAMAGMGATLGVDDFVRIIRDGKSVTKNLG